MTDTTSLITTPDNARYDSNMLWSFRQIVMIWKIPLCAPRQHQAVKTNLFGRVWNSTLAEVVWISVHLALSALGETLTGTQTNRCWKRKASLGPASHVWYGLGSAHLSRGRAHPGWHTHAHSGYVPHRPCPPPSEKCWRKKHFDLQLQPVLGPR